MPPATTPTITATMTGDMHQGGRGQAADQRGRDHQQGPQGRRRTVRLGLRALGPARLCAFTAAACVWSWGMTWNVTD